MPFQPHEQRALGARPVIFNKKNQPRQRGQMGSYEGMNAQGLDPDELCRRLYRVIAEREGKSVTNKDIRGTTEKARGKYLTREKRGARVGQRAEGQSRIENDAHRTDRNVALNAACGEKKSTVGLAKSYQPGQKGQGPPSALADTRHLQIVSQSHEKPKAADPKSMAQRNDKAAPPPQTSPRSSLTGSGRMPPDTASTAQSPEPQYNNHDAQNYRHVPQVAAAQFERTTTADDRSLIHKLSQPAMSFHMAGPEQDIARRNNNASPLETMHSLQRVRSNRDREFERNQFQHPPILEELSAHDATQFRLPLRQTFATHFGRTKDTEAQGPSQRFSVGSVGRPRESLEAAGFSVHHERTGDSLDEEVPQMKWRVDWTQSDEVRAPSDNLNQPKLRKADSKWTLKGKIPGFQKSKENTAATQDAEHEDVQPKSPRSPNKISFFGRFKR